MSRKGWIPVALAAVQWLFFMFANTIVIPISVAAAFHLTGDQMMAALRCSFIVTGAGSILQAIFGHKYALLEGPQGIWWTLIIGLSSLSSTMGMTMSDVGGSLAVGIFLSGLLTVVLGVTGWSQTIMRGFTTYSITVYLFLLTTQLIFVFFDGMIVREGNVQVNGAETLVSFFLIGLVSWLSLKGTGWYRNFAILIGILVGWVVYLVAFPASIPESTVSDSHLFVIFPWGTPHLSVGIIIVSLLAGLINMANSVASITSAEKIYGRVTTKSQYKRSFVLTGLYTSVSALFGIVPYGPYTSTIGFLESTRILRRLPFVLGGGVFVLIGLNPSVSSLFITLPVSVGSAVLFVAFLQMLGTVFRNIKAYTLDSLVVYRLGLPIMTGLSIMHMPKGIFSSLPVVLQPLLSNGFLAGVLLSILLEFGFGCKNIKKHKKA